jgi:hypothetical protein
VRNHCELCVRVAIFHPSRSFMLASRFARGMPVCFVLGLCHRWLYLASFVALRSASHRRRRGATRGNLLLTHPIPADAVLLARSEHASPSTSPPPSLLFFVFLTVFCRSKLVGCFRLCCLKSSSGERGFLFRRITQATPFLPLEPCDLPPTPLPFGATPLALFCLG